MMPIKSGGNEKNANIIHSDRCIPDSKPTQPGKLRKLRIQMTGGISDINQLAKEIKREMHNNLNNTDWEISYEEVKRFGDVGPLHKSTIGFTQKP